ncbi:MAG: 30S ribosomal protein S17e [Candidatus Aenigmarchaeota archaeon]|nr:30S ribosomal protein S17e [Candidatus Aenigmarchaeota archaeon]
MGRIKTNEIKRAGERLMELYGPKLSSTFDENKKILEPFYKDLGLDSKWMRNRIIGYITTLKKRVVQ